MRYVVLTLLILATWYASLVAGATNLALRARLAGREPSGISVLWYIVVVPLAVGAVVTVVYFLDRTNHNLGTLAVGGGAALLLVRAIVRTFVTRRKLNSLDDQR